MSYYLIGKIFAGTFISSQGGSGVTQYCGQFTENKRAVVAGEMKMNMSSFSEIVSPHIF